LTPASVTAALLPTNSPPPSPAPPPPPLKPVAPWARAFSIVRFSIVTLPDVTCKPANMLLPSSTWFAPLIVRLEPLPRLIAVSASPSFTSAPKLIVIAAPTTPRSPASTLLSAEKSPAAPVSFVIVKMRGKPVLIYSSRARRQESRPAAPSICSQGGGHSASAQTLLLVSQERREQITDDRACAGLDFPRHRHSRS